MTKTLTIRLDENEALQLKKIIEITGEKTASKAIIKSIYSFTDFLNEIIDLETLLNEAQNEKNRLKQTIENGRLSALAFADAISQDDIFTDFPKKVCTMNCGLSSSDTRTRAEIQENCTDCEIIKK